MKLWEESVVDSDWWPYNKSFACTQRLVKYDIHQYASDKMLKVFF